MAYEKPQIVAKSAMFRKTMMASLVALAISAVCMAEGGQPFSELKQQAESGDVKAQFGIAMRYYSGDGVKQNLVESRKWFLKAAERGDAGAQYMASFLYRSEKDYANAAKWALKAAEQGDAQGQYLLATYYLTGKGVKKDPAEAFKWLLKAAEQGDANAQYFVGEFYFEGKGVAENVEEAFKWLSKSAKQGNKDAKEALKKPEFQFISAFRNADDMEAGEVCLQKLKEFKNDGRFAKTTNASPKKNALVVKGMYLGMPIDDAVVACGEIAKKSDDYFVVDSRMLNEPEWSKYKPLTKKMKGLDGVCIFTCKNSATGKREKLIQDASLMCRACIDKKGTVNQFYFTKMGIDEIFKAASQTSEEFAEKLQEEYPQIATFDQSVKDKQEDGANKREYRWTYRSNLGYSVELYENAIIVRHDGEDKEIRINDYRRIMANDPNAVGVGFGASQFNKYLSIRMNAKGK